MDNTAIELQKINQTLKDIADKMPKPYNPFIRGLIIIGLFASALGILQAADIIKNWIGG